MPYFSGGIFSFAQVGNVKCLQTIALSKDCLIRQTEKEPNVKLKWCLNQRHVSTHTFAWLCIYGIALGNISNNLQDI